MRIFKGFHGFYYENPLLFVATDCILQLEKGYQATLYALDCIAENENCLTAVMKEICIPVSERLCCEFATVEAEIRRSSERAWQRNSELLIQISPYKLSSRPTVRQFLSTLYAASCTECQVNKL